MTRAEIKKSVDEKINKLCEGKPTFNYRMVKHAIVSDFENILTRKKIVDEIKNRIIYLDNGSMWLESDFIGNFEYHKRAEITEDILNNSEDIIYDEYDGDYEKFIKKQRI